MNVLTFIIILFAVINIMMSIVWGFTYSAIAFLNGNKDIKDNFYTGALVGLIPIFNLVIFFYTWEMYDKLSEFAKSKIEKGKVIESNENTVV